MTINWDELQPPTGASDWFKPEEDNCPKCCLCGKGASRLIPMEKTSKWVCNECCMCI